MLRQLNLTDRFFYACGVVIATFAFGFALPYLVYLAYIEIVALLTITVADYMQTKQKLDHVNAIRKLPKHFSLHDANEVRVSVINSSDSPLQIKLIDEIPYQLQLRDVSFDFSIAPNDQHNFSYDITPSSRGEYQFHDIHVFLSSKLGLVELNKTIEIPEMVKVYPSFKQMEMFDLMVFSADRNHPGIRKVRKLGHGYEFSDIRQYVLGDDPRAINWKATSRNAQLMVNNYQDEKSEQIYAVINKSRVMRMPFNELSLMDYAINATLSMLNIALKNQDHTGLMTFAKEVDHFIPARNKNNQLQQIMNSLYNIESSNEEGNYQGLHEFLRTRVKGRSLLLMFTNFMSLNSVHRTLPELKRINRGHLLVVIFFENTELNHFMQQPVKTMTDVTTQTMGEKLHYELIEATVALRKAGIQTIRTTPENLTLDTINKYLELKARGMI
jgi:uncharacterized protein (DUF58 family)